MLRKLENTLHAKSTSLSERQILAGLVFSAYHQGKEEAVMTLGKFYTKSQISQFVPNKCIEPFFELIKSTVRENKG